MLAEEANFPRASFQPSFYFLNSILIEEMATESEFFDKDTNSSAFEAQSTSFFGASYSFVFLSLPLRLVKQSCSHTRHRMFAAVCRKQHLQYQVAFTSSRCLEDVDDAEQFIEMFIRYLASADRSRVRRPKLSFVPLVLELDVGDGDDYVNFFLSHAFLTDQSILTGAAPDLFPGVFNRAIDVMKHDSLHPAIGDPLHTAKQKLDNFVFAFSLSSEADMQEPVFRRDSDERSRIAPSESSLASDQVDTRTLAVDVSQNDHGSLFDASTDDQEGEESVGQQTSTAIPATSQGQHDASSWTRDKETGTAAVSSGQSHAFSSSQPDCSQGVSGTVATSGSRKRRSSRKKGQQTDGEQAVQAIDDQLFFPFVSRVTAYRIKQFIPDKRIRFFTGQTAVAVTDAERKTARILALKSYLTVEELQRILKNGLERELNGFFHFVSPATTSFQIPTSFFPTTVRHEMTKLAAAKPVPMDAHDTSPGQFRASGDDVLASAVVLSEQGDYTLQLLEIISQLNRGVSSSSNMCCCPYCGRYVRGFLPSVNREHMKTCKSRKPAEAAYMKFIVTFLDKTRSHVAQSVASGSNKHTHVTKGAWAIAYKDYFPLLVDHLTNSLGIPEEAFNDVNDYIIASQRPFLRLPIILVELMLGTRMPLYFAAHVDFMAAVNSGRLLPVDGPGRRSNNEVSPWLDLLPFMLSDDTQMVEQNLSSRLMTDAGKRASELMLEDAEHTAIAAHVFFLLDLFLIHQQSQCS